MLTTITGLVLILHHFMNLPLVSIAASLDSEFNVFMPSPRKHAFPFVFLTKSLTEKLIKTA